MTDTTRKTMQDQTEELISDARGLFSAMYDEDAPDISDSLTRNSVTERTVEGMHRLDTASDRLREFGFAFHTMMDKRDELTDEVARLETQVEAASFINLAEGLLFELRGKVMTDQPKNVVWWIEAALADIAGRDAPEDQGEATVMIFEAMKGGVG